MSVLLYTATNLMAIRLISSNSPTYILKISIYGHVVHLYGHVYKYAIGKSNVLPW